MWRVGKQFLLVLLAIGWVVSFGLAEWASNFIPSAAFYLLPTRGWELLTGVLVATLHANTRIAVRLSNRAKSVLSLIGMAMILYALTAFGSHTRIPGTPLLIPVFGTAMILLFTRKESLVFAVLSNRTFVGFGLISYSIYLVHQPVFAFARQRSILEPESDFMLVMCVLTFAFAYLSWRFIEKPCLNQAKYKTMPVIYTTILAALCIVGVGLTGFTGAERFRQQFHSADIEHLRSFKTSELDSHHCAFTDTVSESVLSKCFSPRKTVYLFGDSHAATLSIALRRQLAKIGFTLVSMTSPGCIMIEGVMRTDVNLKNIARCQSLTAQATDFVKRHPAPIVMSARWRFMLSGERYDNGEGGEEYGRPASYVIKQNESDPLENQVSTRLSELALITLLILVDQIPETGWNVPDVMIKARLYKSERSFSTSYQRYLAANEPVNKMLASVTGALNLVSTSGLLCDEQSNRCAVQINGEPLYRDNNHPSPLLAAMVAGEVMEFIESKL